MTNMLKYLSENCKHIISGDVSFVDDKLCPGYSDIARRDLIELTYLASLERPSKATLIMVGSIFETILYCFLKRNESYIRNEIGNPKFFIRDSDWLLPYLQIFKRYFGGFGIDRFPDDIVDYRDIVHAEAEIKRMIRISDSEVKQALLHLDHAIDSFNSFPY